MSKDVVSGVIIEQNLCVTFDGYYIYHKSFVQQVTTVSYSSSRGTPDFTVYYKITELLRVHS